MSTIKNAVLVAVGTICVGLGVIGILLPLIPGVPFLILAGICFNAVQA